MHGFRRCELLEHRLGRHHGVVARARTIGGGTGEVQRDILAQSILGLPR